MMGVFAIAAVLSLMGSVPAGAEPPRTVEVTGLPAGLERRVRDVLLASPDGEAVQRALRTVREAGYWLARVRDRTRTDPDGAETFILAFDLGARVAVDRVSVRGVHRVDTDRLDAVLAADGETPSQDWIEARIRALLRVYETEGFPFASAAPAAVRATLDGRVDVDLVVEEGPFVVVDSVRVVGNTHTRNGVIIRELRLGRRFRYTEARAAAGVERLRRLPFLADVGEPTLSYDPVRRVGVFTVPVVEGEGGSAQGVLGYQPRRGGVGKPLWTGLVDLRLANLAGTGRALALRWERLDAQAAAFDLRYTEPWVMGLPLTLEGELHQWDRTRFTKTAAELRVRTPLTPRWTAAMGLGGSKSIPDSLGALQFGEPKTRELTAALEMDYDARLGPRDNPTGGYFYRARLEAGRRRRLALPAFGITSARASKVLYRLDFDHFLGVTPRQVVAFGLHLAEVDVSPEPLALSDKLRIGGAGSVRGYRQDEFVAAELGWAAVEHRLRLSRHTRLFAFLDAGYLVDRTGRGDALMRTTRFLLGYGLGARLESRAGLVGLDFGIPRGAAPAEGKLHLSVTNFL